MLWKCCTQYASIFGKLSSSHRSGKGLFPSQSQRKAMPKNAQTIAPLHSFHMLAKWCSKFSKPGFNSTWTMSLQMLKLDLKKVGEPASVPYLGQWIQNGPYILPEMSPWSIKKPPRTPGTRLPWIKSLCPVGACKILLFDQERTGNLEDPQTTAQLHSSHTLVKWCSKFS